jgi:hypothetical protein
MSTLMNRLLKLRSFHKDAKRFEEVCTKIYYFHINRDDDELIHNSIKNNSVNNYGIKYECGIGNMNMNMKSKNMK